MYFQAGKSQDTVNNDNADKPTNGVPVKEISNGDARTEKDNKEQREKRISNLTHQYVTTLINSNT